jgi:hypothetical protein
MVGEDTAPIERSSHSGVLAYASLLLAQTAAASVLFWTIFPIFRRIIAQIGQPQELNGATALTVVSGVIILQCCYWIRLRYVKVHAPLHSVFIGHLFLFASRASFFFGGALFSVFFFRHIPEFDALPPLAQSVATVFAVLAVLFSLFCYSLELERLGRAIEERPASRTMR